ncbi:hypothetical protein GQ43DRAFT_467833 [Delitschia confertaspora ATCC 74209]|uniref:Uncharacterized protein n=1 Tax=Delitschia confertaspora ATCC 74209 TaxID=1513339 RepID=A0A9P4JYC7_9PLEO|nr:hypothetical protein GQ43DRAFT_467833 [Delitschia confertaspora ATCC 74209]
MPPIIKSLSVSRSPHLLSTYGRRTISFPSLSSFWPSKAEEKPVYPDASLSSTYTHSERQGHQPLHSPPSINSLPDQSTLSASASPSTYTSSPNPLSSSTQAYMHTTTIPTFNKTGIHTFPFNYESGSKPYPDEYSKSGGDDVVASNSIASFSRDPHPEHEKEICGRGNVVNPLEVSPASREYSVVVGEHMPEMEHHVGSWRGITEGRKGKRVVVSEVDFRDFGKIGLKGLP